MAFEVVDAVKMPKVATDTLLPKDITSGLGERVEDFPLVVPVEPVPSIRPVVVEKRRVRLPP